METQLTRIAEITKERPNERITSLAFLINKGKGTGTEPNPKQ